MAELARFYGIIIAIFYREHGVPHLHAFYAEHTAVIRIFDGHLLEGSMPRNKLRLIQRWVDLHQAELFGRWEDARNGRRVRKVRPLP